MVKTCFSFFYLFLCASILFGQNQQGVGVSYRNGILIAHRPSMSHLNQHKIQSVEINYFRNLTDSNSWAANYAWATVGFSGLYSSTGNPEVLGQAMAGFLYGELGFFDYNGIKLGSRVGFGLGFVTKKFDQQTNPKNIAIGSHFNATVLLGLIAKFRIKNGELIATADMTHFSNGSWAVPNLGLNNAMLGLGYRLIIGNQPIKTARHTFEKLRQIQKTLYGVVSGKEVFPTGGRKFLNLEASYCLEKSWSAKVGMESGVDLIYRGSTLAYAPEFSKTPLDLIQVSINAGVLFYFNRFSTLITLGAYVRDVYQPNSMLYQKVGLRYQLSSHLYGQIVLKSIYGRADYLSWGLGYRFKNRRK